MNHSEVHSIVFLPEKGWTQSTAKIWLREHNYVPIKHVDKRFSEERGGVLSQLRYRIREPSQYKSFSTRKLPQGINIVFGWK